MAIDTSATKDVSAGLWEPVAQQLDPSSELRDDSVVFAQPEDDASFQTPKNKRRTSEKRKAEKLQADSSGAKSQEGPGTITKKRQEKLEIKQEGAKLRDLSPAWADKIESYRKKEKLITMLAKK